MADMSGVEVLKRIESWHGSTVLMTADIDQATAVKAFNLGVLDQFFPKDHLVGDGSALKEMVVKLLWSKDPFAGVWAGQFKQRQLDQLYENSDGLASWIKARWTEYITLAEPFGIIGRDRDGSISWLQLECSDALADVVDLAASVGADNDLLTEIRAGKTLVGVELADQLGMDDRPIVTSPAFSITPGGTLLGAIFPIEPQFVRKFS